MATEQMRKKRNLVSIFEIYSLLCHLNDKLLYKERNLTYVYL